MALLKVCTFPDPVLRKKAQPIHAFDSKLKKLAMDMLETMYDAPGVGLAANQVGILQQILVIDVDYELNGEEEKARHYSNQNPRIILNPKFLKKEGQILYKEGCLSIPGYSDEVCRFEKVEIEFQDLKGKMQTLSASGLLAVAIQHEIDHLEGKLFIDRLSPAKKNLALAKIKKTQEEKLPHSHHSHKVEL